MTELNASKVGVRVICTYCGQTKHPRGRSAPPVLDYCTWNCPGYERDPQVGDLWPGESEADFGFPARDAGTALVGTP